LREDTQKSRSADNGQARALFVPCIIALGRKAVCQGW